jgi:hypothetical protein
MSEYKPREIIIVLGKTGHGKSRWTWSYLDGQRRVFGYDPLHDAPDALWMSGEELVSWYDSRVVSDDPRSSFRIFTDDEDSRDTFGHLAFLHGNCIFAVEEASLVFEQGEKISGWAKSIVFVGRHRDVSLLVTAQRAASIPIALRSQATRIVSFAQHEGDDLKWLKGFYGDRIAELPMLPRLECLDSTEGEIKRYSIK